jgi:hypothetical protein
MDRLLKVTIEAAKRKRVVTMHEGRAGHGAEDGTQRMGGQKH